MSNHDPNQPSPGAPPGGPGAGRDHPTLQPNAQGFRVAGQQAGPGRRERAQGPLGPVAPLAPNPGASPTARGYAAQGLPPAYPTLTPASAAGAPYGAAGHLAFEPTRDGVALPAAPARTGHGGAAFVLPMPATATNILVARVGACLGALTFAVSFVVVALALTQRNVSVVYAAGACVSLLLSALLAFFFWQTAQFASEKQQEPIRQAGQQRAGGAAPQPTYAPMPPAPRQPQRAAQPTEPPPPTAPDAATIPTIPAPTVEPPAYASPAEPEPTLEAIPFKHLDPAQFEDHEPDKSEGDRVPHTASVAEVGDGGWGVIGVSLRGLSHKHDAKFREDAIAGVTVGSWQLGVVADGGGAYHLSRVGSNVGARAALQGMRARLRDLARTPGAASAEGMNTVLRAGFSQAYEALADEAKARGVTPRDMYTTLLLVAHLDLGGGKHLLGGAQVGDGAVVARLITAEGERRLIRLNTPDIGAANNETVFFQSVSPDDWANRIYAQVVDGAQCYCLAMTDGIADDFTPLERELVRLEEPLFKDVLATKKTPQDAVAAVETLLDYRRPGSFDDRSLICVYNTRERPWK